MRYFVVALVVSLCWTHQDWLLWPLLTEVQAEHDLVSGIPAGLGFQVALSFATAAIWFLAIWKAWPTELENWARAGRGRRGGRNRRRGRSHNSRGGKRRFGERGGQAGQGGNSGNRARRRRGRRGHRGGNRNPPSKPQ